jgi:hypothetical protein
MVNPVLAHMGGIDEIGIFLIPALLAIYALRRAERQARKRAEVEGAAADGEGDSSRQDQEVPGTSEATPTP